MKKRFGGEVKRLVLGSVGLSVLMALTPQGALASFEQRPGSDALISDLNRVLTVRMLQPVFLRTQSFTTSRQGAPKSEKGAMLREYGTGVAAGEGMLANVSLFSGIGFTNVNDKYSGSKYDADTLNISYGGDYAINDKLIVGLSGGYSDTQTDTKFNGGRSETDSWNVAPYAAYVINDLFSVDVAGGYSESDSDNWRMAGAVRVTGDQDSDSYFFSGNARVSKWYGNIGLNGNVGYTYSRSKTDNMTESNGTLVAGDKNTFEQLQIGAQVNYYMERYMPYLSLAYQNEIGKETALGGNDDDDEFVLTQGLSIMSSGAWSGGILVSETVGRAHFNGVTVSGSVNYAF